MYAHDDTVRFEDAWAILRASLVEIHSKNASQLSFEELYRHAYKLVLKKMGDLLYEQVKRFEGSWLSEEVQPQIVSMISPVLFAARSSEIRLTTEGNEKRVAGDRLLRSLKNAWEDHITCMNMVTDVLMYMVGISPSAGWPLTRSRSAD